MLDSLQDYIQTVMNLKSGHSILEHLQKQLSYYGFEKFVYFVLKPPANRTLPRILINSYPSSWRDHYTERGHLHIDPVFPFATLSHLPFTWRKIYRAKRIATRERLILDEASEFGVRMGITLPVHGPDGGVAAISAASELSKKEFDELCSTQLANLHSLACFTHGAILRSEISNPQDLELHLSPRERECLLWTARGKTAWEVGQILSLSEHTVNEYIKSTMQKFNVHSKLEAVLRAVILGKILPNIYDSNNYSWEFKDGIISSQDKMAGLLIHGQTDH